MKIKSLLIFECVILVCLCIGCDNSSKDIAPVITQTIENAYFPYQGDVVMRYGAKFDEGVSGEVDLKLDELAKNENGILYRMSYNNVLITDNGIDRYREIGFYEQGRDLGYFWIVQDKVYFFEEISKEEINDLCQSGSLPELSTAVAQNDLQEETNKGEKAQHEYIEIKDGRLRFGLYNDMVETGFWRSIIWEKGNGLLVFRQGKGAGRDLIELYCKDKIEYDPSGKYGFDS